MPKQDALSSLARQWEILKMLPTHKGSSHNNHDWLQTRKIVDNLKEKGIEVGLRTIQRDLISLSDLFPLELNDKNHRDYGWRWAKSAGFGIAGIASSEALSLRLVELYLQPLLPATTRKELEPFFNQARKYLNTPKAAGAPKPKQWLDKIRVVHPTQQFIAPRIDQDIYDNICRALTDNKQLAVSYQAIGSSTAKQYSMNVLGLIMRGNIFYVAATAKDYEDVRLYAIHRFCQATLLKTKARAPENFDLDQAIANGLADFTSVPEKIKLQFICTLELASYLSETPLAEDQQHTPQSDGKVVIEASVNNTWQLRWWLLSQGESLEVKKPETLRKIIIGELEAALALYTKIKTS